MSDPLDTLLSWTHGRAEIPDTWTQGRAVFGGVIAGAAMRAMARAVAPGRPARSIHATFVGPVSPGPAALGVTLLGEGRSASHAEARVTQDDRLCLVATATFGADRESALARAPANAPPLGDDLVDLPYLPGVTPAFTQHFAFRFTGGFPYSGREPVIAGQVRPRAAHALLDAAWVLALLDAWPPPAVVMLKGPAPASSATLSALFTLPDDPLPTDAWYTFSSRATWVRGGWADLQAGLWGPDGRQLAQMTQLSAVYG